MNSHTDQCQPIKARAIHVLNTADSIVEHALSAGYGEQQVLNYLAALHNDVLHQLGYDPTRVVFLNGN